MHIHISTIISLLFTFISFHIVLYCVLYRPLVFNRFNCNVMTMRSICLFVICLSHSFTLVKFPFSIEKVVRVVESVFVVFHIILRARIYPNRHHIDIDIRSQNNLELTLTSKKEKKHPRKIHVLILLQFYISHRLHKISIEHHFGREQHLFSSKFFTLHRKRNMYKMRWDLI